jgi:hypothetical protein
LPENKPDPRTRHAREGVRHPKHRLGIETQDEIDLRRDKEDKLLIAWGEKYLRNVQPWVSGEHKAKS